MPRDNQCHQNYSFFYLQTGTVFFLSAVVAKAYHAEKNTATAMTLKLKTENIWDHQ